MSIQPDTGCAAFISHSIVHLTIDGELVYSGPSWQADDIAEMLERDDFDAAYVAGLLHDAAAALRSDRSDGLGQRAISKLPSADRMEPFTYAPDPYARRDRLVGLSLCALSALLVAGVFVLVAWRYA